MRRTTPLSVAGLVGLALLAPTSSATAAGETCRGEAATIVGTGPDVTGTEGRDVIVTGASLRVSSLGGDDLVCVAPAGTQSNVLNVDAGAGNDVVDTTAAPSAYYVDAVLGPGADTFEGGPGGDWVGTGDVDGSTAEVDVVRTNGGADSARTTGGADVVDLGAGTDRLSLTGASTSAGGLLAGGDDHDTLVVSAETASEHTIDLATGAYRTAGAVATLSSFEGVDLLARGGRVTISGTTGEDQVSAYAPDSEPTTLVIDLLGGDDDVLLDGARIGAGSRFDLGDGDDRLVAARASGDLALDLLRDRLEVGDDTYTADGVEDAFLMAPRVALVGDASDNTLISHACRTSITGGHGDDELVWDYDYVFDAYDLGCRKGATTMRGGPGEDSFYGSPRADRLFGDGDQDYLRGDSGDDVIRGGKGADQVRAGKGHDGVRGGAGPDKLFGEEGRDVLLGEGGRDRVDGGPGRDRCDADYSG